MEQETILKEILNTLNMYCENTDRKFEIMEKKFDKRFGAIDQKFESMNERFESIEKKLDEMNIKMDKGFAGFNQRLDRSAKKNDGMRVELTETQETTDFVLSKIAQHEQRFRQLAAQH